MKEYEWNEIKKHNKKNDAWIVIDGEIFNITDFIKKHTGGFMPLLAAGKDVTYLFKAIHPPRADSIIKSDEFRDKFLIGKVKSYEKKYDKNNCCNSEYCNFDEIKKNVWEKLNENGISAKNKKNISVTVKTYFFLIVYIFLYYNLLCKTHNKKKIKYILALSVGFIYGIILLAQHEYSHYYTNKNLSFFDKLLTIIIPIFTGGTNEQFAILHAIDHHQTVGEEFDEDLINKIKQNFRIFKEDPKKECYKYQHIYTYLLIPLFSVVAIVVDTYIVIKYHYKIPNNHLIKILIQKMLFVYLLFILPYKKLKKEWSKYLFIILSMAGLSVWIFEYFNHADEETTNKTLNKSLCWHQKVKTASVNWKHNKFIDFFTYGLDKHVEHHFFPCISSNNMEYITPFFKNYGIKYGNIIERGKKFHELLKKRGKQTSN